MNAFRLLLLIFVLRDNTTTTTTTRRTAAGRRTTTTTTFAVEASSRFLARPATLIFKIPRGGSAGNDNDAYLFRSRGDRDNLFYGGSSTTATSPTALPPHSLPLPTNVNLDVDVDVEVNNIDYNRETTNNNYITNNYNNAMDADLDANINANIDMDMDMGIDMDGPPSSMLHQETYQDRIDAWKIRQQQQYSHNDPSHPPQLSVRDADGRMKLITSVSKGSRALIFFMLLWRDVHLYEVADTVLKGLTRLCIVTPLCILFMANLAGVVASLTSPSHSAKKRLKAILNLDKLVETILILYNFIRLTIWPSKYTPREIYIANTLHSVFFLLQSQAFTRVTWDQTVEPYPATTSSTFVPPASDEESALYNSYESPNSFQSSGTY